MAAPMSRGSSLICVTISAIRGALSTTDHGHRAGRTHEVGLTDAVTRPLRGDARAREFGEVIVGGPGAQRPTQIGFLQREQTRPQLTIGRQPEPVAAITEGLG